MGYLPIRVSTLKSDIKLGFDVYIQLPHKLLLYARGLDDIEAHRIKYLKGKKVRKLFINDNEENKYQEYIDRCLSEAMQDSSISLEEKAGLVVGSGEATAKRIMEEKGASFIHPSNDMNVILGQGTAATELLLDHPELDMVVCPVGGGGLIAGTAISTHVLLQNCLCIGAEPMEADDAWRSLKSGKIESNSSVLTVADGLKTMLGDVNFPIIRHHVAEIIRVSEEEIIAAMRLIWERMKIVVEASSAVALAAILQQKDKFRNKKVGLIISGGNVDLTNLPF